MQFSHQNIPIYKIEFIKELDNGNAEASVDTHCRVWMK